MTVPGTAEFMSQSDASPLRVLKLGGSLLDLPDLPERFNQYRNTLASTGQQRLLLLVGGGVAADVVRQHNRLHDLGEHDGHWLAVRAMSFNAHCVARILGGCEIVTSLEACPAVWAKGHVAMVEPVAWLQAMELAGVTLPHRWSFTSDSIAAAIARQTQADILTLLKSTLPPAQVDAPKAARDGLVELWLAGSTPRAWRSSTYKITRGSTRLFGSSRWFPSQKKRCVMCVPF